MTTPTFTTGPDTYTVTDPGDYVLDFLAGDDTLTVNGGTTTTATMDDGDDYVRLLKGAANVDGGAGNDRFDITTSGITASGGIGDDLFILRGGSNQTINGDDGNDRINFGGNVTNLTVDLGAGADLYNGYGHTVSGNLSGGDGNDTFLDLMGTGVVLNEMGGLGNDTYRVDSTSMGGNIVEYTDEGTDTVQLLRGFNYVLPTNVENIIVGSYAGSHGNAATITLNASANGFTGSGNAETVFGMDGNDHLYGKAGDDILWGGTGNDTLDGGLGNDTLYGEVGNDVLNGRDGADTMIGGTGNDTYYVDNLADVVTENSAEGTDNIRTTVTYTLSDNVENGVIASTSGIGLYGNGLDNYLYGNVGSDTLSGLDGNDNIRGNAGDDFIYGGNGNDTLSGGVGNDFLFGEVGNDIINGDDGNDNIYGAGGNDTLNGGAGNDSLRAGDGVDVLTGGTGSDSFIFLATTDSVVGSPDTITDMQSTVGAATGDDVLNFSAIDADTVTTGDQAFTWNGDTAAANSVWYSSLTQNTDGSADMLVNGDVNGDGIADFQVMLHLTTGTLAVDDLVL